MKELRKNLPTLPVDSAKILEYRVQCQKPRRKEDLWSWYVLRRISIYITLLLRRTPITPNAVTWLSLFFFILSGWLMLWTKPWAMLTAVLAYNLGYLCDCIDGELARLRGKTGRLGVFLDTLIRYTSIPILAAFALSAHALAAETSLDLWSASGVYLATLAATMGLAIPFAYHYTHMQTEEIDPVSDMRTKSFFWECVAFVAGLPGFFAMLPLFLWLESLSGLPLIAWFIASFLILWGGKTAFRLYHVLKALNSN